MALGIVQQYPACLIPYALQDLRVHRIVPQNGPAVLPVIKGRPGKLHHLCVSILRAVQGKSSGLQQERSAGRREHGRGYDSARH